MAASHYRLDNLIAIVDRNGLQITGPTREVCSSEPLDMKFCAFGWSVATVDGHDLDELEECSRVSAAAGKPTVVIANTIKGRGVSFMEEWSSGITGCRPRRNTRAPSPRSTRRWPLSSLRHERARALHVQRRRPAHGNGVVAQPGRPNLEVFAETLLELARKDRRCWR